jgi:hypothetical protein
LVRPAVLRGPCRSSDNWCRCIIRGAAGGVAGVSVMTQGKVIRCAIYTRKSTEEGLEQAFNSLDAQREACVAYVASQRHEGWVLSPELYDDGGG